MFIKKYVIATLLLSGSLHGMEETLSRFSAFSTIENDMVDIVGQLDRVVRSCDDAKKKDAGLRGWIDVIAHAAAYGNAQEKDVEDLIDAAPTVEDACVLIYQRDVLNKVRSNIKKRSFDINNEIGRLLASVPHNKDDERSFMAYCLLKSRGDI